MLPIPVLVDSGADNNFIEQILVTQSNIPTQELAEPKEVLAIDGKLLIWVTHRTTLISLTLSIVCHFLTSVSSGSGFPVVKEI